MLEMHGVSRLVASFNDVIPGFVFSGVFFPEKTLSEKPEQVRAFLRGLVRSFEFMRAEEAQAREFIPKYVKVEREVAFASALRDFSGNGRVPDSQLEKQLGLMRDFKLIDEMVPVGNVVDYSFLPAR
ncbi:hypothetical protein NNJEOMEG_00189 [Fundidesulfovibrio magnetotacticus]|uniref:SsuA/THI5-like domain-containing protein n=1 Tax=Fundidesulfovibrio magnetotacticus TaxID=2730080 RepID=A0A6V8LKZ8_9BACT|nr:hypothetical protein [Fundidesulfovibrio magnetotacticus]GFK92364.1 hypothetical protein NNJEOMEG_00189 [Fundidesulfovibrio magnetotacticus]